MLETEYLNYLSLNQREPSGINWHKISCIIKYWPPQWAKGGSLSHTAGFPPIPLMFMAYSKNNPFLLYSCSISAYISRFLSAQLTLISTAMALEWRNKWRNASNWRLLGGGSSVAASKSSWSGGLGCLDTENYGEATVSSAGLMCHDIESIFSQQDKTSFIGVWNDPVSLILFWNRVHSVCRASPTSSMTGDAAMRIRWKRSSDSRHLLRVTHGAAVL